MMKDLELEYLNKVLKQFEYFQVQEKDFSPLDENIFHFEKSISVEKELKLKDYIGTETELFFSNQDLEFLVYSIHPESHKKTRAEIENFIAQNPNLFLFCSLPFKKNWSDWNLPTYIIPQVAILHHIKEKRITLQIISEEKRRNITIPPFQKENDYNSPKVIENTEFPNQAAWNNYLDKALSILRNPEHKLKKIVCARTRQYMLDQLLNPFALFRQLKSNSHFHFFLKSQNHFFMGNTPECLLAHRDRIFEFDALAGTRPRGKTTAEDELLERELLESPKEQFEHQQVVNYITSGLEQIGHIHTGAAGILKLRSLQHIKTPITLEAPKKDHSLFFTLLERLHPTPAVCGMPKEAAMDFLDEYDPIDRGLYAGAIGIINQNYSSLCVGIRSLLLDNSDELKSKVTLYGGAGIVAQSTPEDEWFETGYKMDSFSPFSASALTLKNQNPISKKEK
jgi:menaquinone-specific isochorismate synthase